MRDAIETLTDSYAETISFFTRYVKLIHHNDIFCGAFYGYVGEYYDTFAHSATDRLFREPSIRDWQTVIAAFFAYKNDLGILPDGALRLTIEGYGTLLMQADSGKTSVKITEGQGDVTLDALTATRLIFGNLPPETAFNADRRVMGLLQQWLPLPLSWSKQDNV